MPTFPSIAMLTALYVDYTIGAVGGKALLARIGKIFNWFLAIALFLVSVGLMAAYFHAKKTYPSGMPEGLVIYVAIFSTLCVALSLVAMRYLVRGFMTRYWIAINLPIFLLLAFTLVFVVPILDRHNSLVHLCRQIAAKVPPIKYSMPISPMKL